MAHLLTCKIENHLSFDCYLTIKKICQILFRNTHIIYFAYQRLYADGSYAFLPLDPQLGNYFYKEKNYSDMWLNNTSFHSMESRVFLWDLALPFNSHKQQELCEQIKTKFGYAHGIDIIEKHEDFCDIWCFASNDNNIYLDSLAFLTQFMLYFRRGCYSLMQKAYKQRWIFFEPSDNPLILPIIKLKTEGTLKNPLLPIKKFYLGGSYEKTYLTPQEISCLERLINGDTVKQTACKLKISARTCERHIAKIKIKLNCSHLLEVIKIAIQHNLVSYFE